MQSGSMVRAVRFKSERLPVLIQTARFCPGGTSAPTLFKSSEAKPSLSIRPVGLPPRAEICLLYTVQKWNARTVNCTRVLLPNSSLFMQAHCKQLCNSNVNGQWFKCKQISIYFYINLHLFHLLVFPMRPRTSAGVNSASHRGTILPPASH